MKTSPGRWCLPLLIASTIATQAGASSAQSGRVESYISRPGPATVQSADTYLRLGLLARKHKQLQQAISWLQLGLEQNADRTDLLTELAITQAWNGEYARALHSFDIVLQLKPDHAGAFFGRARVLLWAGRLGEAEQQYQQALAKDPNNLEAIRGLAGVHRAYFNFEQATALYSRALAVEPNDTESLKAMAAIANTSLLGFELRAGQTQFGDSPARKTGRLLVSYRFTPWWKVYAAIGSMQASANEPNRNYGGSSKPSHSAQVGVLHSPTGAWNYQLALQVGASDVAQSYGISARVAHQFETGLNLLVGARPTLTSLGETEVLVDAGLQLFPISGVWTLAQYFQFLDSNHNAASTLAGTLGLNLWRPLSVRLGGALGTQQKKLTASTFAIVDILASSSQQLRLAYERGFAPFHRSSLTATWVLGL